MSDSSLAPNSIVFSIAICTRNRAHLLPRTLETLLAQLHENLHKLPGSELLIVDNASTDHTAQTVKNYLQRYGPKVRYILESRLGIAWARNRAAHEAFGTWLIYVDDDAVPQPGWWTEMCRCVSELEPTPDCILGKVDLEWEHGRAVWFPPAYETLLSRYDRGDEGHWVGMGAYLLTTNTAFRRQVLLDLGGFRADLGHRGSNLLGGEDNDIFNRLITGQYRIWYEPKARVNHWVPLARQSRRWLVRRVFWEGATQPLLDYGADLPRLQYLREMGRDLRRMLRISWSYRTRIVKSSGRLDLFLECARQIGRFWMNWMLLWRCYVDRAH